MDHDQRTKVLIESLFSEFIRLALPAWWDRFDFSSLEFLPQEQYLDPPQGARREIDLVAKVKLNRPLTADGAERWLTLIHVEAEAKDRVSELRPRMFEYRNALRARYKLPVLPIALLLKVALEGIGWEEYEEHYWEERIELFRFAYVGLPGLDAPAHVQGDNILAVGLSGLMRAPESQRAELKAEAMQKAATCELDAHKRYLLCEYIEAYAELHGPHLDEFHKLLLTPKYKEANMFGVTSYERGVAEMTQQMRRMVTKLLEQRFGSLSQTVRERVASLTAEKLEDINDRVLLATSLAELGLED